MRRGQIISISAFWVANKRARKMLSTGLASNALSRGSIRQPKTVNILWWWFTKYVYVIFLAGIILSAFYYGYILTQVLGGVLARKVGGATLIGISVGTSGLLTLLTPIAARAHPGVLIALRIAIGMTEVIDVPKMLTLLLFCLVVVVFTFAGRVQIYSKCT